MLLRRGGGSNLGFPKRDSDSSVGWVKQLQLKGVSSAWDSSDVEDFLEDQGWTDISVLSKKGKSWFLKAKPVEAESSRTFWAYEIQDDPPWSIKLHVTLGSNWHNAPAVRVAGPSRKKVKSDEAPQTEHLTRESAKPPTVPEAPKSEISGIERDRSRSPARKNGADTNESDIPPTAMDDDAASQGGPKKNEPKSLNESAPKRPKSSSPDLPPHDPAAAVDKGWSYQDYGGCGYCLQRHIWPDLLRYSLRMMPNAKAPGLDTTLCNTFAVTNTRRGLFSYLLELTSSRSGLPTLVTSPPLLTVSSSRRCRSVWVCQLLFGVGLMVKLMREQHPTGQRYVIAPRFSSGMACGAKSITPMAVKLEKVDGIPHYTLLCPPSGGQIPSAWLRETVQCTVDLTGAGDLSEISEGHSFESAPPSSPSGSDALYQIRKAESGESPTQCAAGHPKPQIGNGAVASMSQKFSEGLANAGGLSNQAPSPTFQQSKSGTWATTDALDLFFLHDKASMGQNVSAKPASSKSLADEAPATPFDKQKPQFPPTQVGLQPCVEEGQPVENELSGPNVPLRLGQTTVRSRYALSAHLL